MKKIFALIIAVTMLVSLFSVISFAEGDATDTSNADGIITDGEYVTCIEMTADNVKTWTGGTLPTTAKFYVGACRDSLVDNYMHIAIVTPKATFVDGATFQFNFVPDGVADSQQGLFLSIVLNADGSYKLLQHNHKTGLVEDDNAQGVDITELVGQKTLVDDGTNITFEARMPNSFFVIKDTETETTRYEFGETMPIGCFAVIGGQGYCVLPEAPGSDWTVAGLKLKENCTVKILADKEEQKKKTVSGVEIIDFSDADSTHWSFDTFYVGNAKTDNIIMEGEDGDAGTKLANYMNSNGCIDGRETTYTTFTFRGWAGFTDKLVAAGYQVDENDPIIVEGSLTTTESAVTDYGGQYASRFEIEVDVTSLQDGLEHTIMAVLELESVDDGTKYYVAMNDSTNAMIFYYQAPGNTPAPTDTPVPTETPDTTDAPAATDDPTETDAPKATDAPTATDAPSEKKSGCGSVVCGSVLAVLAVGAVVLAKKKEN